MWTAILKIGAVTLEGSQVELFTNVELDQAGDARARAGGWSTNSVANGLIPNHQLAQVAEDLTGWDKQDGESRRALGGRLFELLLSTNAGKTWNELRTAQSSALRTLFEIAAPADAAGLDVRTFPWELMRDGNDEFADPVFAQETPCARFIRGADPAKPPPLSLRVLVVIGPDPLGKQIEKAAERRCLVRQLSSRRHDIDARVLVNPTLTQLRDALGTTGPRTWVPHALHFIGHGKATPDGQGALVIGQPNNIEPWSSHQIAVDLRSVGVRCAVLNACGTSAAVSSSVAQAFLSSGAGAVIAMGADIQGATAAGFAERLYERLVEGDPVDMAVQQARAAIYRNHVDASDWSVPQLIVSDREIEIRGDEGWRIVGPRRPHPVECDGIKFEDLDRFVDRERARALLGDALDDPASSGKLIFITGPAESGKTTLSKWAFERCVRRGRAARFIDCTNLAGKETVEILRLIRDPTGATHFAGFASVCNHVFRGKRPPAQAPAGPITDDLLTWRTRQGPEPPSDWQDLVWSSFVAGLDAWSREANRLILVIESLHLCADVVRNEITERLLGAVASGSLPHVAVLVASLGTPALEPELLKRAETRTSTCNIETAFPESEARSVLETYLALEPFANDEWEDVERAARTYADKHFKHPERFRLRKLPAILLHIKQAVRGV